MGKSKSKYHKTIPALQSKLMRVVESDIMYLRERIVENETTWEKYDSYLRINDRKVYVLT